MRNNTLRLAMLLTLCALVFLFALHAKTAVYNGPGPAKVTPITASKLWLSGQKMEVRSVETSNAVLFWMAALCLFGLLLEREPLIQSAFKTPPPRGFSLRYVRRFLRPPPAQG
jgi:hypothetical protein